MRRMTGGQWTRRIEKHNANLDESGACMPTPDMQLIGLRQTKSMD